MCVMFEAVFDIARTPIIIVTVSGDGASHTKPENVTHVSIDTTFETLSCAREFLVEVLGILTVTNDFAADM